MTANQPKLGKYIDPLTDWGFKHLFGGEPHIDILREFLNDLFQGEKYIEHLEYGPTEHNGEAPGDKRAVFDLKCRGADGEHFIIEMQRIRQEHFRDRAVYYTSRLISSQLKRGGGSKDYNLPEVYLIGILEFRMDDGERERYLHDIVLSDRHSGKIFYKKLGLKFLDLCNFVKEGDELASDMDRWFYLLKHMSTLDRVPTFLNKRVFQQLFQIGEVSKLKKEERMSYESSLKTRWDNESAFNTVRKEGRREGLLEGERRGKLEKARETAARLLAMGLPLAQIAEATDLPLEEINKLK